MAKKKNINQILSANIVKYRKALGYSQEKFAELIELSVSGTSDIETGKSIPRTETFEKITRVLNVDISDLFKTTDEQKPNLKDNYNTLLQILENHKDNSIFINAVFAFVIAVIKKNKIIK